MRVVQCMYEKVCVHETLIPCRHFYEREGWCLTCFVLMDELGVWVGYEYNIV